MDGTKIQWTDASWNPIRGCTRVSAGCVNCYAERVAARFSGPGMPYEGFATMLNETYKGRDGETMARPVGPRWTGNVGLIEDKLDQPMRWKRQRKIFVNSMSDLFHEGLSDEDIFRIFDMMSAAVQLRGHTFQVLTKRADRMHEFCKNRMPTYLETMRKGGKMVFNWPVPNVWMGVSVENQAAADERIPLLLDTPAYLRWISAEPLLGPVTISRWKCACGWRGSSAQLRPGANSTCPTCGGSGGLLIDPLTLDWVVVGGESGPGARGSYLGWIESIVQQCQLAGIPPFVKQLGSSVFAASFREDVIAAFPEDRLLFKDKKGGDMTEWPDGLRIREWPKAMVTC